MDGDVDVNDVIVGSQVYPTGTRELYPNSQSQEGHFYSECSNKGLCDRSSGVCECFEGFEGSSCQRASCPNDCSGHGTCESIAELASDAGGTLYGDWIDAGDTSYTLWDKKTTYGCKCDPWFYGADCSLRRCKVGIDPMYACGTPIYDTQVIRLNFETGTATGYFRLRFYDYWGESYITERIPIIGNTLGTTVAAALLRLPNSVISSVTCELMSALSTLKHAGTFTGYGTMNGVAVACKFTSNPGRLRLMDILDYSLLVGGNAATDFVNYVTGTTVRGEDVDLAGTLSSQTCAINNNEVDVTMTADTTSFGSPVTGTVSTYKLAKVNDQYILITNYDTTKYVAAYKWGDATVSAGTKIYASSATISADAETITTWEMGSNSFTASGTPTVLVRGTLMFYQNQFFTVTGISGSTVTVDRRFIGASGATSASTATATDAIYIVTKSTSNTYEYVSECSGRGLCGSDTGICTCFKGYTKDNCNTQNILAL